MKNLLSLDSPLIHFMEHIADFFILNILTVLCCIPLVTAGAALTAHSKIMQNLVLDEEQPVVKAYFHAFAQNFKQATVFWLAELLLIVLYVVDILAVYLYFSEGWAQITYVILGVLGVVVIGVLCYAFSLIARYENTVREHLRNSLVLALAYLPKTLLLVFLAAMPLILGIISLELLFFSMIIWFTFGISIVLYLQALILKPILLNLDQMNADGEEG